MKRIVAYAGGNEVAASRDFYVEVLGMRVVMEDPVLDLQSPDDPAAEIIVGAQEMQDPQPSFGIDVGDPAAVDAVHAEAVRRELRVVYPLTDEPWGVRRFFVEDPGGTIVNLAARHMSIQIFPAMSAASVVIVEGPHDRAALNALIDKLGAEEAAPGFAAYKIALIDAGAADASGGTGSVVRLADARGGSWIPHDCCARS